MRSAVATSSIDSSMSSWASTSLTTSEGTWPDERISSTRRRSASIIASRIRE